jgi:hypothetical protein
VNFVRWRIAAFRGTSKLFVYSPTAGACSPIDPRSSRTVLQEELLEIGVEITVSPDEPSIPRRMRYAAGGFLGSQLCQCAQAIGAIRSIHARLVRVGYRDWRNDERLSKCSDTTT